MGRKTILILLALLLVLGGFYAFMVLSEEEPVEQDMTATGGEYVLTDIEPAKVMRLSYNRDGEEFSFKYSVKGWLWEGNEDIPLDQTRMESIVNALCKVTSDRLLDAGKDDMAGFGLDPVHISAWLETSDGEKYGFNIGAKHPTTSKYYFNIPGSEEIYTVPTLVGMNIDKYSTIESLMASPRFPNPTTENITSFSLTSGGKTNKILYLSAGSPYCYTSYYKWFLDGGKASQPLHPDKAESYFETLSTLGFFECVDYASDPEVLAKYGLDKDYVTLTFDYESASRGRVTDNIYIGKGESGLCYGRVDGSDVIGRFAISYDYFLFDYEDYKALDFCKLMAETVDSMTITLDGKKYEIEATHVLSTDSKGKQSYLNTYICSGEQVSLDQLFTAMQAVKYEKEAPDGASPGEPYIQIVFKGSFGQQKQMTLNIWQYDSSFCLSEFGGDRLLINKRDAESLANIIKTNLEK